MRTTKYYKVQPSVAERSGVADVRYRTADGMMILNEQDVRMIRLEPEEYLKGVVEAILTEEEADLLIEQGGKRMGLPPVEEEDTDSVEDVPTEEPDPTEENTETTEDANTEEDGYEVVDEPTDEEAVESEEPEVKPTEEEVTNE